jgi:hypothetical protein
MASDRIPLGRTGEAYEYAGYIRATLRGILGR